MCQRTVCSRCNKFTYSGCGNHVEQVLAGVPTSQRCTCGEDRNGAQRKQWRLFGRG
jgi:hypothetical protein